jgi:predicted secreted protein
MLPSEWWDNRLVADPEVLQLQVGDEHVVRLAGRGTAGYRWAAEVLGDDTVAEISERQVAGEGSGAAGGSADELFRVRALAPGSTRIAFAQRRPWEAADAAPAREHVVELRVSG